MKYKIILTNSAYRDLENIKQYISKDNPLVGKQYISKIFDKLEKLSLFPKIGKVINNSFFDYSNCFYLVCMNHISLYQINEVAKCVYIIRVLSHFQDWKNIINKQLINDRNLIISDSTISICHFNESMYYDVWKNSLDENNRKYVPDEVFESLEEATDVVDQLIQCYSSEDGPFVYAIIRNSDNANLGYVQLVKIDEGWEIGYHIAQIYNGKGYATRGVGLFLQFLKNSSKLKEIYGVALANNKASRRVLEKNGFELIFEGTGLYQGSKRKIIKTIKVLK